MKKANLPLIIGSLILLLILSIIIFPEIFTGKSPYNMQKMIFSTTNGSLNVERAPYPPSKDFIMGSDEFGRDIYSFIIYGTGLTILLGIFVALGRFIIAVPMALSAGFGNNATKTIIRQFSILFSAIPALLISVIILKLEFFTGLDKAGSIAAFVIVLSMVGWPKLGNLIMERVDTINRQPFIRSEIAIGKSRFRIAIENVFPHLASEITVLFFMEIARALSMIMQMGIFSVFVGLLKIIKDTEGGVSFFDVSFEPEWAGMLSTSRSMASVAPWTVLFPAIAFFISVLGFNLFGEGLRTVLQKRESMFVPRLRKLISFDFKYIWSGISKKIKLVTGTVVIIAAALVLALSLAGGNKYKFSATAYGLPDYESVAIGTEQAVETAGFIENEMIRMGIKPLDRDDYIVGYDIGKSVLILDQSLILETHGKTISAEFEIDYSFRAAADGTYSGSVYDATREDMFSLLNYSRFDGKFVMIDSAFYNDAAVSHFIRQIINNSEVSGILLVVRHGEKTEGIYANESPGASVILITKDFADKLKSDDNIELTITTSLLELQPEGKNVIGIFEGAEGTLQEEAIIIGMGYNYLDADEKRILEFNIQLMEKICLLEKNSRSIIFIFIDGTGSDALHGIFAVTDDFPYGASKVKAYIDLTGLKATEFDNVKYSSVQAPFTRQYAWGLAHQIEKLFSSRRIEIEELKSIFFGNEYYFTDSYASNAMFYDRGVATMIIGTDKIGSGNHHIYEIGEIVLETIKNNNY